MGAQKALFDAIEEVDAFDGLAVEAARPRQPIEGPDRCAGQGRYWEIRDTLFTVKDAAGPAETAASSKAEAEHVNVRGAIFGV